MAVLNGQRVVSASYDRTLWVWDVGSGETRAVFALDTPLRAVAITADGLLHGLQLVERLDHALQVERHVFVDQDVPEPRRSASSLR